MLVRGESGWVGVVLGRRKEAGSIVRKEMVFVLGNVFFFYYDFVIEIWFILYFKVFFISKKNKD